MSHEEMLTKVRRVGTVKLSAGFATVDAEEVSEQSLIFLQHKGPVGVMGLLSLSDKRPGAGFSIRSNRQGTAEVETHDNSEVDWLILEP
jgi:hypothetical protein